MSFFDALNTSASGLTAQRVRMDVIASNLANVDTTRTAKGGAYRREMVVFEAKPDGTFANGTQSTGVQVAQIVQDPSPFRMVYDPSHPDANAQGYVAYPNVNTVTEMTDMISATRSYEANVTVVNGIKSMASKAMEI